MAEREPGDLPLTGCFTNFCVALIGFCPDLNQRIDTCRSWDSGPMVSPAADVAGTEVISDLLLGLDSSRESQPLPTGSLLPLLPPPRPYELAGL